MGFKEAVGWTGLINGWYNIVTFLIAAFSLVALPTGAARNSCIWPVLLVSAGC